MNHYLCGGTLVVEEEIKIRKGIAISNKVGAFSVKDIALVNIDSKIPNLRTSTIVCSYCGKIITSMDEITENCYSCGNDYKLEHLLVSTKDLTRFCDGKETHNCAIKYKGEYLTSVSEWFAGIFK